MKCWGSNSYGQLGDNTTTNSTAPVAVYGLGKGIKAITAGNFFACALTTKGEVLCWGANSYGQLGNGTTTSSAKPVAVSGLGKGSQVPGCRRLPRVRADHQGCAEVLGLQRRGRAR